MNANQENVERALIPRLDSACTAGFALLSQTHTDVRSHGWSNKSGNNDWNLAFSFEKAEDGISRSAQITLKLKHHTVTVNIFGFMTKGKYSAAGEKKTFHVTPTTLLSPEISDHIFKSMVWASNELAAPLLGAGI